ncbi:hypothetical protein [Candidatus Frankia alpina]|uniref:hypothetical protein n=1 Tax=Candidatus Frankia alpina TaxID=2699483 RepID=UPI001F2B4E79|nr:hypothetical protein [Candidatus Frankia alpina]
MSAPGSCSISTNSRRYEHLSRSSPDCGHALDYARTHSSRKSVRITPRDIQAVESTYSAERPRDIAAEYRFQRPGLLGVFQTFRAAPATWSRADLELFLLDLATGAVHTAPEARGLRRARPALHSVTEFAIHPMFHRHVVDR